MSDASQQAPLGPTASRGLPAQLAVRSTGDTLTASAAVPFSLGAILPRGLVIVFGVYALTFVWRTFAAFGQGAPFAFFPLLWVVVFAAGMLGSAWGLVMAIAGRVTATFDRSQVTFLQEAFGLRRSKSYDLSSISAIGVKTGRLPNSVNQQARFDGVMGQNKPGSCLALRRGFGTVALFPGMPEADLLSLLGRMRAHYAMLGIDLPFADEQPAEAVGATAIDTAPPAGRSESPIFASSPPSVAAAPPSVPSAPPSVASGPPSAPSFPAPVAVTGWKPARLGSLFGPPERPPLSDKPVYDPEEPPR